MSTKPYPKTGNEDALVTAVREWQDTGAQQFGRLWDELLRVADLDAADRELIEDNERELRREHGIAPEAAE